MTKDNLGELQRLMEARYEFKSERAADILRFIGGYPARTQQKLFDFLTDNFNCLYYDPDSTEINQRSIPEERIEHICRTTVPRCILFMKHLMQKSPQKIGTEVRKFILALSSPEERAVVLSIIMHSPIIPWSYFPEKVKGISDEVWHSKCGEYRREIALCNKVLESLSLITLSQLGETLLGIINSVPVQDRGIFLGASLLMYFRNMLGDKRREGPAIISIPVKVVSESEAPPEAIKEFLEFLQSRGLIDEFKRFIEEKMRPIAQA